MKKTLKKVLATLLAVVLLFGAAPMLKTDGGVLATKASALETVSGSYDYLVNYINNNGQKDSSGDLYIYGEYVANNMDIYVTISYSPKIDHIACVCLIGGVTSITFGFNKTEKTYLTIATFEDSKYNVIDQARAYIDPATYDYGTALSYTYDKVYTNDSAYISKEKTLFNSSVTLALKTVDKMMRKNVGFGLGNFGFTKISESAPIPEEPGVFELIIELIIYVFAVIANFFTGLIWFI